MPEPPLLEQALTLSCGETRVTNVSWVEGRQARNFKIPCTCCLATYHCRDDPRNHRAAGQFPAPRVYSPRPRRIRIDERIDVEQRRGRFSADFTPWKRHCRPRPTRIASIGIYLTFLCCPSWRRLVNKDGGYDAGFPTITTPSISTVGTPALMLCTS